MDYWIGNIIDDYQLYKLIEAMIGVLLLVTVYLGIRITLMWKCMKKNDSNPDDVVSQSGTFIRSTIFIFITGFFMVVHEFFEGLEKDAPDYVTYELFELIAILGLVLFLYEWYKILNKLKK